MNSAPMPPVLPATGEVSRRSSLNRAIEILWATALILLPITSAPWLIKLTGTLVAPPSFVFIGLLLALSLLPRILRRGTLPLETLPLVFFVLFALVSTALAFFIDIPTFKNANIWKESLEALITLGMGISFFLVAATQPAGEDDLRKALRWITIGGAVMVAFTLVQAFFMFAMKTQFADWYIWLEETFITPRPFSRQLARLYGMAFEPSWFTHMLVMLYIPIWLGATFQKISGFRLRIFRFSLENIFLAISLVLFLLAKPRISLLAVLLIFAFVFIKLNSGLFRWLKKRVRARFPRQAERSGKRLNAIIIAVLTAIYLLLGAALVWIFKQDYRLALIFAYPPTLAEIGHILMLDPGTIVRISTRFQFMERAVYWLSGWQVFADHPFFGVGPGNSGFFFLDNVPALGWTSIEVRYLLEGAPFLPNIKSLWVRLLAETGLVGFSIFVAWLSGLWRSARHILKSALPFHRLMGFAGQIMLIGLIAEGFSIDSFALPYLWIAAGLVAAAGASYRAQERQSGRVKTQPEQAE